MRGFFNLNKKFVVFLVVLLLLINYPILYSLFLGSLLILLTYPFAKYIFFSIFIFALLIFCFLKILQRKNSYKYIIIFSILLLGSLAFLGYSYNKYYNENFVNCKKKYETVFGKEHCCLDLMQIKSEGKNICIPSIPIPAGVPN